jgi:hypothetical protein
MGFFDKLDKPVFLKETSDSEIYIKKLKELQPRATGSIRDKIDLELKLASIGKYGEDNVVFELKNSSMPMYVLRDIHLEADELSAQIDFIVITRKLNFFIECKNLIGNIHIDNKGNFIREYKYNRNTIKEGIYSPITQNQRHLDVYKRVLSLNSGFVKKIALDKFFDTMNKSIVVLANPKTILHAKYAKKEIKEQVVRADGLNQFIKDACDNSKLPGSNDKELEFIANSILNRHTPNRTDYSIKYEEILNTVGEAGKNVNKKGLQKQGAKLTNPERKITHGSVRVIENEELDKKLKEFRLNQSREENVPPYFIFNDSQMKDLTSKMPQSKKDLLEVSGFGEVKVEKYGDSILKILNEIRQ